MLMQIFLLATFIGLSQSNNILNPFPSPLKLLCDKHPNTCYEYHYKMHVQWALDEISRAHKSFARNGMLSQETEETCRDSLSLAFHNLDSSLHIDGGALTTQKSRAELRKKLIAAGANLQTCLDGFKHIPDEVTSNLERSAELVTKSLAIIRKIDDESMSSSHQEPASFASEWLSFEPNQKMEKVDVVVAKDGSGKYMTISEAIKDVPPQSEKRFVIYVKKGVYNENVVIQKQKWNVLMYGDGMDSTVVSSNRCNKSGSSTSASATFAVYGNGFIAKNMGFRNTAGPDGGQAVALLSSSDQSVFYRCLFDGYQDTLCTNSNRQFYRECKIYGTMDFIYGEAAAVIQNSDILVRKPKNSGIIVTAQGKWDPQSTSGIVIQKCRIQAAEDLGGMKIFLGRPWKDYSTVVVMESELGSLVDPAGWSAWGPNEVAPPSTVLYVEHGNTGPGARVDKRVTWKGVRVRNCATLVSKFTVTSFINGDRWIPATGVPFDAGL